MADFYIVPPRLTVGTFDRANVVNSINSLKGDLTFIADANSGIRVVISGNTFRFSITENYYVKKQGDTYPKNLVFTPEAGYYGLSVGSGAADPGTGATGGLFFNTTSNSLKVYNGSSWGEITGAGITQGAADLRYLKIRWHKHPNCKHFNGVCIPKTCKPYNTSSSWYYWSDVL